MNEVEKTLKPLESQMRHLNAKYGFLGLPDTTRLNLQYGRYVCGQVLEDWIRRQNFMEADAAELRILNAETALGESLVPSRKTSLSGERFKDKGAELALQALGRIDAPAFFLRFIEIKELQVPELLRRSKISKAGPNSFLEGVPLRRVLFSRLCAMLEASEGSVDACFLRLLWIQMYCRSGILVGARSQDLALNLSISEHEHLLALLNYWTKNHVFLQKILKPSRKRAGSAA